MDSPPSSSAPSQKASARRPNPGPNIRHYFSYGSNLHLAQMAHRCPESIFKGKAVLSGYRWQINERGVANIVKCHDGSSVEGLLFSVQPTDEKALDLSEGVLKGFYQKYLRKVAFEPHALYEDLKTSDLDQLLTNQASATDQTVSKIQVACDNTSKLYSKTIANEGTCLPDRLPLEDQAQPSRIRQVKALVYISENYKTNGVIREEYISRMKKAVLHAMNLGVSQLFIEQYIVPHLNPDNAIQVASVQGHDEGQTTAKRNPNVGKPTIELSKDSDENQGGVADQPRRKRSKYDGIRTCFIHKIPSHSDVY